MILPLFIPISVTLHMTPYLLVQSNQSILNSSCVCIFVSFISVFANFLDYLIGGYDNGPRAATLMYAFFAGLVLFAFFNIAGVFKNKPTILYFSFFIWLMLTIYWFCLCAVLYSDWYTEYDLCVNHRCPDSFWLNDWYWRSLKPVENTKNTTQSSDDKGNSTNSTANSRPKFEAFVWYSMGSIAICLSFLFYLAMLGSLIWNHCNADCTIRRGRHEEVAPGGYLYIVELRRRSLVEGGGATTASTPPTQQADPPSQVASNAPATAVPRTPATSAAKSVPKPSPASKTVK